MNVITQSFIIDFFNAVLYQPFLNILIILYTYIPGHDFGIAVIILTVLIRLLLSPASMKAIKSQKAMSKIQPKMEEIRKKYKNDKEKQSQAMMELYQKEKINPFSGCFPLLLQLPILIALYQVFLRGLKPENLREALYGFVKYPETLNLSFLGIIDLSGSSIIFAIIAGVLQFFQSKLSMQGYDDNKENSKGMAGAMQKQMIYFFPLITVFLVWRLGSLIGLYWITTTLFSIGEYYFVNKRTKKVEKN